jgi:creatinine amidohydrolase
MQLSDLKWSDVDKLSRDTPIVLPIAALEQHGRHMPLFTDSLLCGEVVRRASENEKLKDRVVFAPMMWLGNSEHHLDFPGTMSAAPRTYLDLLREMAENFLFHGFRRIVFVNGHGGNTVPSSQAIFELRQKNRSIKHVLLLATTYWDLAKPWEQDSTMIQRRMGHACEFETSMMLRLAPHLVAGDVKSLQTVDFGSAFEPGVRGWITKDRTEPGHIGHPQHATAEKGETLFRAYSDGLVSLMERVLKWDGVSWNG